MSFFGSQFNCVSNDNIDPVLLGNDDNNQDFLHDVEMATDDNDAHDDSEFSVPFAVTTSTPRSALNPQAAVYEPVAHHSGSSSSQPLENVNHEFRTRGAPTYQWQCDIALRTPPHQHRLLQSNNSGLRLSNQLEPLAPQWPHAHITSQQDAMALWPYFHQDTAYLTPPDSGALGGYLGRSALPLQPAFESARDTTAEWNSRSYNPGDRTRTDSLAPLPTPTRKPRGRSRAASSASALTCETCDRKFGKQHELDHHRRIHGNRKHVCPISGCPRDFVFHKDLVRHMNTHNKERHIFCNILGCKYREKGFGRVDHLKRHNEKKHPGNPLPTPSTTSFGGG